MKKPIFFICFIITIIVGLSIVQVSVSNNLTTTGIELSKIEEEITNYQKENTILSEQLLTLSSFDHIASQAADLGFVSEKGPLMLSNPQFAAKP